MLGVPGMLRGWSKPKDLVQILGRDGMTGAGKQEVRSFLAIDLCFSGCRGGLEGPDA